MKSFGLGKSHKLCSTTAIDRLFAGRDAAVRSALAYPVRMVWAPAPDGDPRPGEQPVCFFISIPKKRLRHAVDRVAMRRRIREQYRLLRPEFFPDALPEGQRPLHVAFIYVASNLEPSLRIRKAMQRLLPRLLAPEVAK